MSDMNETRSYAAGLILIIERIAGVILGLVTVLIVVSAIGRYIFATPVPDAFDLSRLILGVAIAWGLASLGFHGTHIKVDLLAQGVRPELRRMMNLFAWLVLLASTALLTFKIWERVYAAMIGGDVTMELRLPHWPFFLAIWLGLAAALYTTIVRLLLIAKQGSDLGEYDGIDPQLMQDIERK